MPITGSLTLEDFPCEQVGGRRYTWGNDTEVCASGTITSVLHCGEDLAFYADGRSEPVFYIGLRGGGWCETGNGDIVMTLRPLGKGSIIFYKRSSP